MTNTLISQLRVKDVFFHRFKELYTKDEGRGSLIRGAFFIKKSCEDKGKVFLRGRLNSPFERERIQIRENMPEVSKRETFFSSSINRKSFKKLKQINSSEVVKGIREKVKESKMEFHPYSKLKKSEGSQISNYKKGAKTRSRGPVLKSLEKSDLLSLYLEKSERKINNSTRNQRMIKNNSYSSQYLKEKITNEYHRKDSKEYIKNIIHGDENKSFIKSALHETRNFNCQNFLKTIEGNYLEKNEYKNSFFKFITNSREVSNSILSETIVKEIPVNRGGVYEKKSFSPDSEPINQSSQIQNHFPITINATVRDEMDIDSIVSQLTDRLGSSLGGQR